MKDKDIDLVIQQAVIQMEKQKGEGEDQNEGYTAECLSEEAICDYLKFGLSPYEREKVEDHLSLCTTCRLKVITIVKLEKEKVKEKVKESDNPARSIIQAITEGLSVSLAWVQGHLMVTKTNSESFPFGSALQPIYVRGDLRQAAPGLPSFSKTFHEYKIIAHIGEEGSGKCQIRGEITPIAKQELRSRIRVDLFEADRKRCSYPLEDDTFFFDGIDPGQYEIRIREGDRQLALLSIDISGEGE